VVNMEKEAIKLVEALHRRQNPPTIVADPDVSDENGSTGMRRKGKKKK